MKCCKTCKNWSPQSGDNIKNIFQGKENIIGACHGVKTIGTTENAFKTKDNVTTIHFMEKEDLLYTKSDFYCNRHLMIL